ncbi:hypothetical protein GCM10007862_07050 [Dyella lipolytica]|uniref:Outer membrane lipoprotein n=1 Tax=Dyella lipolytica TaxID=1867835 RepID=A0ABW8J1T2_9GAMM|nr:hypothetical protein [Dyella lipolytica]GLQ45654.1 hypothetical protein GCM10007862_07050 [Dyella lipolytica]
MRKIVPMVLAICAVSGCTTAGTNMRQCSAQMSMAWPSDKIVDKHATSVGNGQLVYVTGTITDAGFWKENVPAKVQCTFRGTHLEDFHWVSPPSLANGAQRVRQQQ